MAPARHHAGRPAVESRRWALRKRLRLCTRKEQLRRTLAIALAVGLLLSAINEPGLVTSGHATWWGVARLALNFIVLFVVSNLGVLSGGAPHEAG